MAHNDRVQLRTGLEISQMGLGTATFGGLYTSMSQEECDAAIDCALDNGITYIDTAPHYGKGTAERRLAKSLKGRPRSSFEISTKIGRLLVPTEYEAEPDFADTDTSVTRIFDFSEGGVEKSFRSSLERLDLEKIDILMIHDPDDNADLAIRESFPALLKMREKGIINAIGVGMNQSATPARLIMEADIDLKALYTVRTRVSSIMDPIKYTPSQIEEMNTNVPVDVVMYMKGNLWKPTTSLDLELNNANAHAQEIVADNIIGESEKAKQAVSLLMQGSFLIPDNSTSGSSVLTAGLSNAGQFITGQVNNYLSQITGDALNVGFDYNGASDSLSTVSMNVSKNLYNDKVVVSGTFDLGKDASDMEVQYKITRDVTVKAFRKSQQNQKDQEGSVPTQGASIFIRKEFDSLKELFTRKKKEK